VAHFSIVSAIDYLEKKKPYFMPSSERHKNAKKKAPYTLSNVIRVNSKE
jgi:hypothetical protein